MNINHGNLNGNAPLDFERSSYMLSAINDGRTIGRSASHIEREDPVEAAESSHGALGKGARRREK